MAANARKSDLVDPKVQGALAKRLVSHWFVFIAAAAILAFALQWMSNPFLSFREHAVQAWWTHGPLLLVLCCLLPIFVFDSIKFSHRFAGPVFRLRQITKALASGEATERVEFRGTDFWRDLAQDLNRIAERLDQAPAQAAKGDTHSSRG